MAGISSSSSPPAVWALVLAAGTGSRFGGGKLLAPYRGTPLLQPVLEVVRSAVRSGALAGGAAVLPAGNEALARLVRGVALDPVTSDDPGAGLAGSLRSGLAHLARRAGPRDAALIFLGDQPGVRETVVATLVAAFRHDPDPVRRPRYRQEPDIPGHPVLIPRRYWHLAGALEGDRGFGALLQDRAVPVHPIDVPGRNPGVNLPGDLARLESEPR